MNILRALIALIGILLVLPGLYGIASLASLLASGRPSDILELHGVFVGLFILVGFTGLNMLLRADLLSPAAGARIALAACAASCLVIAAIGLLLLRAFGLSEQELPAAPRVASAVIIALSAALAPLPLYWFWKKNR